MAMKDNIEIPIHEKIPIYMPDDQVKKFLEFQEHYEIFKLLLDRGAFEQKNCTVLLDFDRFGVLKSIRRNDFLYTTRT